MIARRPAASPALVECQPMPHFSPPANPRSAPAARVAVGVPWMFVLLVAAWLFDFQSEGEGQGVAIQAYFAATFGFALVMLLIGDRAAGLKIRGMAALATCGALYLLVGIASGLVNGQEVYPILRNSFNVAIYLSTTYVTARVVLSSDPAQLRQVLAIFCLSYSLAAYIIFSQVTGGVDLERVRYQIVGASVIAALGYVVLAALFKLTKIEMAAMAVNGIIVLLSVTRSFLIVLGAQAMVYIGQVRRVFSPRLIAFGLLGILVLLGVLTFGQSQLTRWNDRILGGGGSGFAEYQTLYTRLSEWDFMYRSWTQSIDHFLFGSGIAAKTVYYLPREMRGMTESMVGFGHNQHLSMLFTGGVIGGLPLLVLQWFQAYLGWRFLRNAIKFPHLRSDMVFLGAWGATMVLGHNAVNILSATFMTRGSSLWFGIGTGLLLGAQAMFDPANRPGAATRAPPRASRYQPT
jgi:O-Antigen ligase